MTKLWMVCLGFKPGAAGDEELNAQINQLNYGL